MPQFPDRGSDDSVMRADAGGALPEQGRRVRYVLDPEEVSFARDWLAQQIERGKREQFGRDDVDVSPELASLMLEHNRQNRPIRQSRILQLAREIEEGNWLHTHQGIAFSSEGQMIDGQHRCHAILRTAQTVKINVDFGLDPRAFRVIDTHAKRTAADALHVHGHAHTKHLAAATTVLLAIKDGQRHASVRGGFSPAEIDVYVDEHAELVSYVQEAIRLVKAIPATGVSGVAAGLFLIGDRHPNYGVFTQRLKTGVGFQDEFDPIARLRARLARKEIIGVECAACIIKAFNAHVLKKRLQYVGWRGGELFPDVQAPVKA